MNGSTGQHLGYIMPSFAVVDELAMPSLDHSKLSRDIRDSLAPCTHKYRSRQLFPIFA